MTTLRSDLAYPLGTFLVCLIVGVPEAIILYGAEKAWLMLPFATATGLGVLALGKFVDWLYR